MCEFCTQHGEGKKWYLQMKNYADALLHQELSAAQKGAVAATTRFEWNNRFWRGFILPAIGTMPRTPEMKRDARSVFTSLQGEATEDAVVAQSMIEHFGQVLPIEDVEKVIDLVDSITRMPCGCRYITTGKTDKRYCFGLGIDKWSILGRFPDAAASLEVLDKEEAKKLFRQFDKEGLMHSIWTGVTPYVMGLCNCDRDCGAYIGYIEMRGSPSFFRAEYIGKVDWDLCTGCKSCLSQCQFGAMFYSSAMGNVHINPTRCFGCGVCRAKCPRAAIRLIPRSASQEAAHLWLN